MSGSGGFVTCPECGATQPDRGHFAECEDCGYAPMPTHDDPEAPDFAPRKSAA